MCLIAHRAPSYTESVGAHIPEPIIDYNIRSNSDGFGLTWRQPDGSMTTQKFEPTENAEFKELLLSVDADESIEYVAHWRKATTGSACRNNSHPFTYEDAEVGTVYIFHNGVIGIKPDGDDSDTAAFVKLIAAKLPSKWWDDPVITFLVEDFIGWSRLAIMTKDEVVRIEGHGSSKSWQEKDGLWYSTYPGSATWTPPTSVTSPNTSAVTKYSDDDDDDESFARHFGMAGHYYSGGGTWRDGKWYTWNEWNTKEAARIAAAKSARKVKEAAEAADGIVHVIAQQANKLLPEGTVTKLTTTGPESGGRNSDGSSKMGWMDLGHWVESVGEVEEDSNDFDFYSMVRCTICGTMGEVYINEGEVYLDVMHDLPTTPLSDEAINDAEYERWMGKNIAFPKRLRNEASEDGPLLPN